VPEVDLKPLPKGLKYKFLGQTRKWEVADFIEKT
jgi:hypothetical protein